MQIAKHYTPSTFAIVDRRKEEEIATTQKEKKRITNNPFRFIQFNPIILNFVGQKTHSKMSNSKK